MLNSILQTSANFIIAAATIAYVVVTSRQLHEIRNQVAVAKESSEAALLNATALVNAERPWIVPRLSREEKWIADGPKDSYGQRASRRIIYFALSFKNVGKTPAEIMSFGLKQRREPWGQELPLPPDHSSVGYLQQQKILAAGEEWSDPSCYWHIDATTETAERGIKSQQEQLWWYGGIEYKNLVDAKTKHQSRICYMYSQSIEDLIVSGPPEYTQYT